MLERRVKYNPVYGTFFETPARHAILWGGRGSGKSVAIIQKHIRKCLDNPGYRHLTLRKVLKSCRHSTFQLYTSLLTKHEIPCKINRTEMTISFHNGSEILHSGLDDPLKLLSIADIDSIHTEEADQVTEDEFEEVDVLMRGKATCGHFQHTLSFNPRKGKLWARRRFVEAPDSGGAYVLHTTWRDNIYAGKEYGERLAAITDPNKRAIYERGEWGEDARGLVYESYSVAPPPDRPPDAYGFDYGFVHPMVVLEIWDEDPYLHVRQIIYAKGMKEEALITAMGEAGVDTQIPLYCEHMPGVIKALQDAGYNAVKADKSVEDGIATVNRYKIVLSPDSQDLIDEIDDYRWQETREGQLKQSPVKVGDDGMDAMRYAAHSHIGVAESAWGLW